MDLHAQKIKLIDTLRASSIDNEKVLNAIEKIPRELFVLEEDIAQAYANKALPIQCQQTISQPYIIALMTQALLEKQPMNKVLEIGTGSGYQTAILSYCVRQVFTIERIEQLHLQADSLFKKLELKNIQRRLGDGYEGWPEHAPFDGILVTAAPSALPEALKQQLNPEGGRMVIPIGDRGFQQLLVIDRQDNHYHSDIIENVQFVPLIPGTE